MVYSRWFAASLKLTDISAQYLLKLAMNKHNKSLGKRSTNTLALSTKISNIKQSINPTITVRSLSAHPKTLKLSKEQFQTRTVRLFKNVAINGSVTLTFGEVVAALGLVSTVEALRLRVLSLKAWNMTFSQTSNSNYIRVVTGSGVMATGAITSAEDIGTASSLPGVHIVFPRTLAQTVESTSAQTVAICTTEVSPLANSSTFTATVCYDVGVEYKYDNAV